jgi:Ca2+/Na+ antiporter
MVEGAEEGFSPFFPPSQMTLGQLFFNAAIYGYVLSEASNLISDGSELLLLVPRLAPVVGSIVLPVLGAVPDGMMVMFSGLGDDAQNQVAVGVGALAGSTVMLLTLPWFIAVFCGRVNIVNGECTYRAPVDKAEGFEKLTPKASTLEALTETGVGISDELHQNARIMLTSIFGYFIMQVPALLVDKEKPPDISSKALRADQKAEAGFEKWFACLGFIVCLIEFVLYLKTQWDGSDSGLVEDRISTMHVKAMQGGTLTLQGAIAQFRNDSGFSSIVSDDAASLEGCDISEHLEDEVKQARVKRMCRILAPFFAVYDVNGDNSIDLDEFRMLFRDIRGNLGRKTLESIFKASNISQTGSMSFEEFAACIISFALYPDGAMQEDDEGGAQSRKLRRYSGGMKGATRKVPKVALDQFAGEEDKTEEDDEDAYAEEEEEEEDMPEEFQDLDPEEQQRRILFRSCSMMGLGTVLVVLFSDPIVDVFYEMGVRLSINPFYISFVLAPMASNASEMISAYNYAKKRTQKSINTALSTLEGAAVMNNTFVLGVFYALVFFKGLAWEFTAEIISTVFIQVMIGGMVLRVKAMRLLDGCVILAFYIIAMGLVYVLEALGID